MWCQCMKRNESWKSSESSRRAKNRETLVCQTILMYLKLDARSNLDNHNDVKPNVYIRLVANPNFYNKIFETSSITFSICRALLSMLINFGLAFWIFIGTYSLEQSNICNIWFFVCELKYFKRTNWEKNEAVIFCHW